LFTLQQTDLDLDASRRRVRDIDALLIESDALRSARQSDQEIQQRIAQLRVRMKNLELESATLDAKIQSDDDRLYGGAVKNPKELGDLQKDAASLRRRKSDLDGTQLELMIELEQADQDAVDIRSQLKRIEAEWQREQADLIAERDQLVERIGTLDIQRKARRAEALAPDLATYDQLRTRRHGQVIAPIRDGACGVCGVELSEHKITRVQREDVLIACGNCERLLTIE
jgi:predicted  nucleic acid-binding Zn-ribbon protein